jgi:hypothetical protein
MAPPEHRDHEPGRPLISVPGDDPFGKQNIPVKYAVFGSWHTRHPDPKMPDGVCEHHDEMCLGLHDDYQVALKHLERIREYRNLRGLQLFSGGSIKSIPIRPLDPSDLQFERLNEPLT